ncbi:MAG: aldehyde ferredoxin oxidoreductase family protein [Bacillota bacterium]
MFKYRGYAGQYIRVDLTRQHVDVQPLPTGWAEEYLGGNGVGTRILWDEVGPGVDPLSPENRLVMATGPLCGTLMPNSGRVACIAKSPLTGIYGDSNAGGFLGPELKFAGYDLVVFQGRASSPAYLLICDDRVELRDASHLWGKDCLETEESLRKETGETLLKAATIGPAGENLVSFASINVTPQRQWGRSGMGAVMGSKNLKAVAVRGTGPVTIADREGFYRVALDCHQRIRRNAIYPAVSKYGTPGIVSMMNAIGRFPTKNFQQGHFDNADRINAETLRQNHYVQSLSCFGCPVGCDKAYGIKEGPFAGTVVRSVEYETLGSYGAGLYIDDLNAILKANDVCDRLGLDTISAGRVIGFLMELWEKGLITKEDTGGLEFPWGNAEVALKATELMAYRRDFGDLMAGGVRRLAARLGRGAEHYAMEVKGQELAAQDGRAQQSMGLASATSTRGADHLKAFPTIDETGYPFEAERRYGPEYLPEMAQPLATRHKAYLVKDGEEFGAIIDSTGMCKSGGTFVLAEIYWPDLARAVSTATGMELDVDQLKKIGERIYNLQRCYIALHGITAADDTLPQRLLTEPSPSKQAQGQVCRLDQMLPEYYRLRQWDPVTGRPSGEKLAQLGLDDARPRLEAGQ